MTRLFTIFLFLFLTTAGTGQEAMLPAEAQVVTSESLASEYSEQLSAADRLSGLSLLWSEAKYNFANFDLVPDLDWDAHYRDTIPLVLSARSTAEYYQELRHFYSALKDGHSGVNPPRELFSKLYSRPPVFTRLLEGRVIIDRVNSRKLSAEGLNAGLEILQIDGIEVHEYAARNVRPYQSASTPQDLDVRVYRYGLLQGDAERSIRLQVSDENGLQRTVQLPRSGYDDDDRLEPRRDPFTFDDLGDGILLLDIRSFSDASVLEEFTARFADISQASGLVIDLRNNGGGNSGIGWGILAQLVDKPFPTSRWKTRLYRPSFRAWGRPEAWSWHEEIGEEFDHHGAHYFAGPVAVLSGPQTYSAAEDFLAAFRQAERGPIIGSPSGGSTGQPLHFKLPGGGTARVCTKRDLFADGTEFVGAGIEPDILVEDTVASLRAGQDAVARQAKRYLLKQLDQ